MAAHLRVYPNYIINFIAPPPITIEQRKQQAYNLFRQALFMLQNNLTYSCKDGFKKRPEPVRSSLILDPTLIKRDCETISKRGRVGAIRSS